MPDNTPAVITKVYDLLLWILPKLAKFPREQRFLLAERIENGLLDILEILIEASFTKEKLNLLRRANLNLEKLRFLLRLAKDMHYINLSAYEYQAKAANEIGRMLGGWIKSQNNGSAVSLDAQRQG
ncbi:MAG: four helix bundle protein [Candidatus Omnitrophica bacterium CG07_land_8_20_14_0_80_42_15]|uniref:Four helix bundle protein n=1 Tax=Candidatus Aquitaenariimonas noxiae TaxID=1974741 RepID=A0A2J0L0V8_9BACT|nr:MAG: four helix bundle protein [Candidatus Omnitrophica bacterium CG07_land_8_20_14_0_80_42_15]